MTEPVAGSLVAGNDPARFWRLLPDVEPEAWQAGVLAAMDALPPAARGSSAGEVLRLTLGEGQFGPHHWSLPAWLRLYYRVKSRVPRAAVRRLRRAGHGVVARASGLGWPIEDRYRRFLWDAAAVALRVSDRAGARFVFLWPRGSTHALVLTHDIESARGQSWVSRVADLEERLGFRSAFNFVAGDYPLDAGLIRDLHARGFEVGVHGLLHDGHEFSSRSEFERRAAGINRALVALEAVGFRAPLTHRNPEWMQALRVEYDSSFFDTDPFEPIPGGTMSLWPFLLGHFVELPYTLPQDCTLTEVLGERTPAIWLTKTSYLARWHGMALVNTHPDYLLLPGRRAVYEEFLETMRTGEGAWLALPRDVARWWRRRLTAPVEELLEAPDVATAELRLTDQGKLEVELPALSRPR